jgi:hypothetical protein
LSGSPLKEFFSFLKCKQETVGGKMIPSSVKESDLLMTKNHLKVFNLTPKKKEEKEVSGEEITS